MNNARTIHYGKMRYSQLNIDRERSERLVRNNLPKWKLTKKFDWYNIRCNYRMKNTKQSRKFNHTNTTRKHRIKPNEKIKFITDRRNTSFKVTNTWERIN